MKTVCLALLILFLAGLDAGYAATPDPIDRLVGKLSASNLWMNGCFPILGLPATASPEQVIQRTFEMTGFDEGHITKFKIIKIRQVQIRGPLPDQYSAALVGTNLGEKIVLFKYEGPEVGWWERVYKANEP